MTEQYTPTTDEVRAAYFVRKTGLLVSAMTHYPEFDRWLTKRDAEVAAKAWAEGYKLTPMTDNAEMIEILNPYRKEKNGERTE